jgi:hypothetical protein
MKSTTESDWLGTIIRELKRTSATRLSQDPYLARLYAYAQSWIESGYRLNEWTMRPVLQRDIQHMTNVLLSRSDGQPYLITLQGHLKEPKPIEAVDYVRPAKDDPATEHDDAKFQQDAERMQASETFLRFLVSPDYDRLGRCARCETWFFNRSGKRTRYCSVKCAKLETSNEAKKATREREALNKVLRVEEAIRSFNRLSKTERRTISLRPDGWKGWVARKAGKDITTNLITRLLNAKKCEPPNEI